MLTLDWFLQSNPNEADSSAAGPSAPKQGSNSVKTNKGGQQAAPGGAPHFVWNIIFDIYFPQPGTPALSIKGGKAQWTDVWRLLVDQSLFAPPSMSQKATGFSLLQSAIQRLPPAEVPTLFGEATVRTFANHLRKTQDGEKTLSRVAERLATALPTFIAANPSVGLAVIKALIAPPHGSHQFESKIVERLVAKLDVKGVKGWAAYLKEFALGEEHVREDGTLTEPEEEKLVATRRVWAFDQLLHIAKSGAVEKDDELLASLLEFFAVLGWFEVKKSGKGARSYVPVPAFTDALQTAARSRFFSILTALPATPSASSLTWLSRALSLLDNLSADSKHFAALHETDDEVTEARETVKAMYATLDGDDVRRATARSLVEGALLLSYDEGAEASEALDQLIDTLPALFPDLIEAAPKEPSSDDEDDEMAGEDDGDEPEPATVLVDMLLELLHRPSAFIKGVVQSVFIGFADELGEQGMELLLEQIRPEVAPAAEAEDATAGDVPMDGDNHDHAGHSHDKPNGKKKAAPVEESDDESSDDDVEELGSDEDGDVDEAFRNELLAALQANGVADELEEQLESSEDKDEDEEELLDDDQMMALDDKLADIFRLQGGGNKGRKVDRIDDMHYKLRVVDLLESLAKHKSSNPLLILVLMPLFSIVQSTAALEEELRLKATKLLRTIVGFKSKEPVAPAEPQMALDALNELHTVAASVENADLASLCSQTGIFLVKAALASAKANKKTSAAVAKAYANSLSQYLTKKNSKTKVQPLITVDFCKRAPATAWALWAGVVAVAGGDAASVNAYRRMQAFEVAHALLTSYGALKTDEAKAEVVKAVPAYKSAILAVLNSSVTDAASSFDASRLKEVAKLALAGIRITTAASSAATAHQLWSPAEFVVAADTLRQSPRFKGAVAIQSLLKQVVTVAGGTWDASAAPAGKKSKRKAGEAEDEVKAGSKAKKAKAVVAEEVGEVEVEVEVEVDEASEVEEEARAKVVPSPKGKAARKERKKEKKRAKEA